MEKGKVYSIDQIINYGLTESNNTYANYIVFKKDNMFYLFKPKGLGQLLLAYVGY